MKLYKIFITYKKKKRIILISHILYSKCVLVFFSLDFCIPDDRKGFLDKIF